MRLKEEQIMIILGIIGLLIIAVVSIGQYSDSKIDEHQKNITLRQGKINNIYLHLLETQASMNRFELYEIINPNVTPPKADFLKEEGLTSEEYNKIDKSFREGKISKSEFFTQMKNLYAQTYDDLFILYDKEWKSVERDYLQDSLWKKYKMWTNIILWIL